jgi:hypothetical protein
MKLFAVCAIVLFTVGCASEDKIRSTPTAELKLRREQLVYRLNGAEWGQGAREHREDLFKEKEKIELELLRRHEAGD